MRLGHASPKACEIQILESGQRLAGYADQPGIGGLTGDVGAATETPFEVLGTEVSSGWNTTLSLNDLSFLVRKI